MTGKITTADAGTPGTRLGRVRRRAFAGYRWLLLAFLLLGAAQIFLAGLGVFNLDGQELGAKGETAFDPHRNLGWGLAGVAFLILVVALVAQPGVRAIILSAVLFLLVSLAQSALAAGGEDSPVFGG